MTPLSESLTATAARELASAACICGKPKAARQSIFARRVRAHNVTIPARPYLPGTELAEREAARVVEETLQGAIDQSGAGAIS